MRYLRASVAQLSKTRTRLCTESMHFNKFTLLTVRALKYKYKYNCLFPNCAF